MARRILTMLIFMGQAVHVMPLVFFFVGMFWHAPSFGILLLLLVGIINSAAMLGLGQQFFSVQNIARIYYGFCLNFSGCSVIEYPLSEVSWLSGEESPETVKVFQVTKNTDPTALSPQNLSAYITDKYSYSYLFLTDPPSKMTSTIQRFKLFHELGHIYQGAKDDNIIDPLALGFLPLLSLVVCMILNVEVVPKEVDKIVLLVLCLLSVFLINFILVGNLRKMRWIITETEADRFSLARLTLNELNILCDKVRRINFLAEVGVHKKDIDLRLDIFLNRIGNLDFSAPKISYNNVLAFAVNSFAGLAIFLIGMMCKDLSFANTIVNILLLLVLPFLVYVMLYFFRKKYLEVAVDKAVLSMKDGRPVERTAWLDFMLPLLKFFSGDWLKK